MARYKHVTSGAVVSVRDDKVLGSEWKSLGKAEKEAPAGHAALKVPELKAEIDKRNKGRDEADQISSEGNKADLVAALEADDAKSDNQ